MPWLDALLDRPPLTWWDLLDILVQQRKDTQAAKRVFRQGLGSQTQPPIEITTDKLRLTYAQ